MAKVSKKLLKEIVKECLVEILAEGLTGGDSLQLTESIGNVKSNPNKKRIPSSIQKMMPPKKVKNSSFEHNINETIRNTTQDPIMAEILADTAQTTLQEQNTADSPNKFTAKPTDTYSKIVENNDPMELFENSASNWAHLAFADNKN